MSAGSRAFRVLAAEALRDASRRRIVPAVAGLTLLSLALMEQCAGCQANLVVQGQRTAVDLASWAGMLTYSVIGTGGIALAGLLAADQLRVLFDEGSAILLLSRPIGRATLALSRLAGSLAVSLGALVLLCGGAALVFVVRSGLAPGPAVLATAAVSLAAICVAALAMTASLFLPRIVTVLAVLGVVSALAVLNVASVSGRELSGLAAMMDAAGPPITSAVLVALAPWSGTTLGAVSGWYVWLRAIGWAIGSVALLAVVFDQRDLTRLAGP